MNKRKGKDSCGKGYVLVFAYDGTTCAFNMQALALEAQWKNKLILSNCFNAMNASKHTK
jgi:hypothetical protein